MTHEERNRQIYHIIRIFDWRQLWNMLKALDWMWLGTTEGMYTPSIGEMVVEASKLLKEVATIRPEEHFVEVGLGGFYATRRRDSEGTEWLELRFSICEASALEMEEDND